MIFLLIFLLALCYIAVYFWISRRQRAEKAVLFMIAPSVEAEAIPEGLRQFYRIVRKKYPKARCFVGFAEGCSEDQKKVAEKVQAIYHYEIYKDEINKEEIYEKQAVDEFFQKIYLFVNLRQDF